MMEKPKFQIEEPLKKSGGNGRKALVYTMSCAFALTTGLPEACGQAIPAETGISAYDSKETQLDLSESTANMFEEEFNVKSNMLKRLEQLYADLSTQGWDGYDAHPMEAESYRNMKSLLSLLTGSQLRSWNLFPSPNGTFMLSAKGKRIASVSVGNNGFSYAAMMKSSKMTGMESFNPARAAKVVDNILSFLEV